MLNRTNSLEVLGRWLPVLLILGGCAMSDSTQGRVELKWEWPAGRAADQRLLVRVEGVKKVGGGFLFWKRTPSIAENLPDPVKLVGAVVTARPAGNMRGVALVLPKVELPEVAVGDLVALGVLSTDVCICVTKAPAGLAGPAADEWLASWSCEAP